MVSIRKVFDEASLLVFGQLLSEKPLRHNAADIVCISDCISIDLTLLGDHRNSQDRSAIYHFDRVIQWWPCMDAVEFWIEPLRHLNIRHESNPIGCYFFDIDFCVAIGLFDNSRCWLQQEKSGVSCDEQERNCNKKWASLHPNIPTNFSKR
ncbi:hypothetical protein AAW00_04070 [Aurantiacibacter luteus]|uniref:Uncharacterized protein n=1 Tax=Aurantiacibacter luteus TaxID=1581420 RepID=A0A0G9MXX4_9SPHN|nr:hypothetical protein AAW00_04070 [Aurantiacibacter luteus]